MNFFMYNSVLLSKILKIVVPLEQNFENSIFDSIKLIGTMIFNILDNTTELWMTKYIIGEIFSSGGATFYKNPSDQTVISKGQLFSKQKLIWSFTHLWHEVAEVVRVHRPLPLHWKNVFVVFEWNPTYPADYIGGGISELIHQYCMPQVLLLLNL